VLQVLLWPERVRSFQCPPVGEVELKNKGPLVRMGNSFGKPVYNKGLFGTNRPLLYTACADEAKKLCGDEVVR
jgi:hypothetical protein